MIDEYIYEDDVEMGILYDIQRYYDIYANKNRNDTGTLKFLDGIEDHLKCHGKISKRQFNVLKEIKNKIYPTGGCEE